MKVKGKSIASRALALLFLVTFGNGLLATSLVIAFGLPDDPATLRDYVGLITTIEVVCMIAVAARELGNMRRWAEDERRLSERIRADYASHSAKLYPFPERRRQDRRHAATSRG